jgi:hypothetical protein
MQDNWITVNGFIRDALELGKRLDLVSTRDSRSVLSETVKSGREDYQWLLSRRPGLSLSVRDEVLIEAMLDRIRARIKFLEKLAE